MCLCQSTDESTKPNGRYLEPGEVQSLLDEMEVELTKKELKKALGKMDEDGEGKIGLEAFLDWYATLEDEGDEDDGDDDD